MVRNPRADDGRIILRKREGVDVSLHRYPPPSLALDGIRAGFGILVTLGPLAFLDVAWPMALVLVALAVVFVIFALRVAEQCLSSIELSDQAISREGWFTRSLRWSDMTEVKLAHYAAPRSRSAGWYQLTLKGRGAVLKVESTIEDFDAIVEAAREAVRRGGLALDPVTGENFQRFGLNAPTNSPRLT